ncbi:hypothetical protein KQX64_08180 [Rhodopseudomonas palustris]|nr:hypothetical protein KQX64_08180 [Rhodopseudomonas palustris]
MVAVTGEVANRHLRVGNRGLDHGLDVAGIHRHSVILQIVAAAGAGRAVAILHRHPIWQCVPFKATTPAHRGEVTATPVRNAP